MPIQNFFVLTTAQANTAYTLDNDQNAKVWARPVDNSSPGVGINLNAVATGIAAGVVVTLAGKGVIPKRVVDDPSTAQYAPNLAPFLLTLPFCLLESETIFAPPEPE